MITLMGTAGFVTIGVALFIVGIVVWASLTSHRLRRLERAVQQAESAVDLALTKRFAVIARMHEAIRTVDPGIVGFSDAVTWQNGIPPLSSIRDKAVYASQMDMLSTVLGKSADTCPALPSDPLIADLRVAIANTDDQLQTARRLYNATVSRANKIAATFPDLIVANALRIEKRAFFDVDADHGQTPEENL